MSWILTSTGKRFDLFKVDADLIDLRDISHSLAHLCRFNGHTREFYSVAQHSCIVAELVPEKYKLAALLHDATEAYLGDMTRPLKQWMPYYRGVEDTIRERICERFNLALELPACVHQADLIALATERRDLMPSDPAIWDCLVGIEPMAETIRPWSATDARITYHQRLMDQIAIENRRKAA
ncbi:MULTISPECIES: phosphohydrolase [Pseudomonas]|uniref:phosphohydrolase n=1 Tax=Pseudomonas TaxID=286 RepID=UPI000B35FF74|nr:MULTISPECIES: phosphohydrolase [Pseudomonas]PMY63156.1 phosphohydrolase [Pseudomonas sp. FW305-25]PMY65994.1 phosphohydrolase [Pseudomonas sp. FW126-L8]PNA71425.1 phosphohydrolase [Pseudomonas sp. FW305-76]